MNYDRPEYWQIFYTLNHEYCATNDTCDVLTPNTPTCIGCIFTKDSRCLIDPIELIYQTFIQTELPNLIKLRKRTHPEYFI